MNFKHVMTTVFVLMLGACELFPVYQDNKGDYVADPSVVIVDTPAPTKPIQMDAVMGNENVIIYPVEGDVSQSRQSFPEYRGVMENTTRGGYTVFDSSVTVFAVEGNTNRPGYLPEYSIPQYAEQYRPVSVEPVYKNNGPLVPMMEQLQNSQYVPNPPMKTEAGRRSGPVLTAYE